MKIYKVYSSGLIGIGHDSLRIYSTNKSFLSHYLKLYRSSVEFEVLDSIKNRQDINTYLINK